MEVSNSPSVWLRGLFCGVGLLVAAGATGCQSSINGQTLPSAYYRTDDIQYFAPGPEFKLSKEAAAMKEARAEKRSMPR